MSLEEQFLVKAGPVADQSKTLVYYLHQALLKSHKKFLLAVNALIFPPLILLTGRNVFVIFCLLASKFCPFQKKTFHL